MDFGVDVDPPAPPRRRGRGEARGFEVCETGEVWITFGDCGGTCSSIGVEHKVPWVSCLVCCRLGPMLPGGNRRGDADRNGTGKIFRGSVSDAKGSVSTVWAVDARKGW